MSYRFHNDGDDDGDKKITLNFTSGNTVTLGVDEGDTTLSLKKYIWSNKLGGLTSGYGRIVLSSLSLDEAYNLYDNTTNSVISVTIRDRITNTNVDLRGEDFEDDDLSHDNFSMSNLSDANFLNANLSMTDLSNADLQRANLSGADLSGADFSMSNLSYANFLDADLEETIFDRANLSNANLSGSTFVNNSFEGANLQRANLSNANFFNVTLLGANLSYANLHNITIDLDEDEEFSSVDFSGVILSHADLSHANLKRSILKNIDMSDANLFKANLSKANLHRSNLSRVNLSRAIIRRTNMSRANLSGANLSGADLSGSNLSGANLSGADLSGANLSGAIGLNLDGVIGLNLSVRTRLLNATKEGDSTKIDEILKEMPDTQEKQDLKILALNQAIRYNKAGPTINLLVDNRNVIGNTLRRFDIDAIDRDYNNEYRRHELLTQNPPRLRSTDEKCNKLFDHIVQDDIDIIDYLNAKDVDDSEKRNELEKRAILFVGETPSQLNPVVMSLDQLLHNLHSAVYTSDCVKNGNGEYFETSLGSRVKDAIFQFQFTSRYNVYLRNLIDVILNSDKRVFYILPLMGQDGQRIEVKRVASLRNVGIENPLGNIEPNYISALHCQRGTTQQMYGIYVCEGQGDNPLYPVCS